MLIVGLEINHGFQVVVNFLDHNPSYSWDLGQVVCSRQRKATAPALEFTSGRLLSVSPIASPAHINGVLAVGQAFKVLGRVVVTAKIGEADGAVKRNKMGAVEVAGEILGAVEVAG